MGVGYMDWLMSYLLPRWDGTDVLEGLAEQHL